MVELKGIPSFPGYGHLALAGDMNGDGFSDVIIAHPTADTNHCIFTLYYGSPHGLVLEPVWRYEATVDRTFLLRCAAIPGDLNGDGMDDLLITENEIPDHPIYSRVRPVLFLGATNGMQRRLDWPQQTQFGSILLKAATFQVGDLNGDGFDEVALLAADQSRNKDVLLSLAVFFGSAQGPSDHPNWVANSESDGFFFTHDVASLGDVNGDGYGDLLIGDVKKSGRYRDSGKAYVYYGSPTGPGPQPSWTAEYPLDAQPGIDEAYEQFFSWSSAGAGDVNGDGYQDVLIGACYADHGDINEGVVFCYYGSAHGLNPKSDWRAEGNHLHVLFGTELAGAVDINGDGFDDVVIGAPLASNDQLNEGAAVVYYGSPRGLVRHSGWSFESNLTDHRIGGGLVNAGDLNGDGYGDFLVSNLYDPYVASKPELAPSKIYAVYGGPKGLAGSGGWRPEKPWFVIAQQTVDRTRPRTFLFLMILSLSILVVVFLLIQTRLRHRLARLIAENQRLSVVEERARIARDMHDHLGSNLTQLALQVEKARQDLPRQPHLSQISRLASQVTNTLDELVWSTDPEHDDLDSLASYLAQYAIDFLEPHGLPCQLEMPVNLPAQAIPSGMRHQLFMIVKEALHNVVRHAQARQVTLRLAVEDSGLQLEIWDNGCGFAFSHKETNPEFKASPGPAQAPNKLHHGLKNMQARIERLQGEMRIESQPGQGTRISFHVPLRKT